MEKWSYIIVLILVAVCACSQSSDSTTTSDADSDADSDSDSDSDSDADSDSDSDSDSDADSDSDSDADSDSDSDADSESDTSNTGEVTILIEENEMGFCEVEGDVESIHSGFTGLGYANTANVMGKGIVWHLNLMSPGIVAFQWRYAFEAGESRDATLLIDGKAESIGMEFASTGAWNAWSTKTMEINMQAGEYEIRLEAVTDFGLANIDSMEATGMQISVGNCDSEVDTGSDTESDTESDSNILDTDDTLKPVHVYIAGDSTASSYADSGGTTDQAGWGQMLHEYLNDDVSIENWAAGGRTAYWFYLEGSVQSILDLIVPGDYFLIQFGTNDSHPTATFEVDGVIHDRFAAAGTAFKQHLLDYYINPIREAGAIPVLVTPPPRNSAYCVGGNAMYDWAQAMRELGETHNVAVSDLSTKTVNHLIAICPSPTPEDFFYLRVDGSVDGTHFQENGARIMAGFVMEGFEDAGLELVKYRD